MYAFFAVHICENIFKTSISYSYSKRDFLNAYTNVSNKKFQHNRKFMAYNIKEVFEKQLERKCWQNFAIIKN